MRAGIIQSSFIPWRGYLDFIASVDVFVFLEDVQYTSRDWRNRNRIKTPRGTEWLTVPVIHEHRGQKICETRIDRSSGWVKRHLGAWSANYRASPCYPVVEEFLAEMDHGDETISELNIRLLRRICAYLEITTPTMVSTDLRPVGEKTARLLDLVDKLGADTYLSGPSADQYLDKEAFRSKGIQLEYKGYDYDPYPQLWGQFDGAVSVLDLIANCGKDARRHLQSRRPNTVVIRGNR